MTPDVVGNSTHQPGKALKDVILGIANESLADLVEVTLRLEDISILENSTSTNGLLVADIDGFNGLDRNEGESFSPGNILLLVGDEVDIPEGFEYLVVPLDGDDVDLDPALLVNKVRDMLTGKRRSRDRNPTTDLPGTAAFEAELRERITSGERFGIVFSDLNQFKSYNKAYSYTRGDQMLIAVGELMTDVLDSHPHPQNFIAHLGSDDFAIITSEKQAQAMAEEIVDLFDEMVAGFYDIVDLERGSVFITDRRGVESECPIVTISLAVILSSRRAISHAAEVLDIAEDLLALLKSREVTESCCVVERKSAKA